MNNLQNNQKSDTPPMGYDTLLAAGWFDEKLRTGEIDFITKTKLFDLLMKNLEVMSISDYAKEYGISYNGTISRIDSGKLNALCFRGDTFVFEPKKVEIPEYFA